MQPTDPGEPAAPLPAFTPEELAPHFPQLEILDCLGRGGMGVVYRARQKSLNRLVALKLLPASLAERDAAFAGRFEREGQLLARLHHPNIVAVHDSGTAGGFFYLIMEYVDGVNLRQAMRARRFTPGQALAIVPRICDALQFAHDEGVLHRDIKPENILIDAKGRVKLADFGIAKLLGSDADPAVRESAGQAEVPGLTQSGTALGTPSYMSPEQRDTPADVDHRADIYSLGVVFYELLTGELPQGPLARPSEKSDADPRVDAIVQQAMQKERDRRQQSVGDVRTQVETITGSPTPAELPDAERPLATNEVSLWSTRLPYLGLFAVLAGLWWTYLWWHDPVEGRSMRPVGVIVSVVGLFLMLKGLIQAARSPVAQPAAASAASPAGNPESRFSRTAIWAASWILLCTIVVPPFIWHELETHEFMRAGPFASLLMCLVWFVFLIPAFAAPLGATLLGWIGVTQIRRSGGKLYGLGLAVFGGLFFPLLALDALIIAVDLSGRQHVTGPGLTPGVTMAEQNIPGSVILLLLAVIIVVDFLIIRAVWLAVNKSLQSQPPADAASPLVAEPNSILSNVAYGCAWLSGILAAITWSIILFGTSRPPEFLGWSWSIPIAALAAVALAIPVRKSPHGKWALWFGSIQTVVWLIIAGFSPRVVEPSPHANGLREIAEGSRLYHREYGRWPERVDELLLGNNPRHIAFLGPRGIEIASHEVGYEPPSQHDGTGYVVLPGADLKYGTEDDERFYFNSQETGRAQPLTVAKGNTVSPIFGPEIERVLPSGEPCREPFFQFRSGDAFIVGNGPGTSPDEAAFDYKRIDDAGGVDMSAISGDEGIQIAGRGCFFTQDVEKLKWDRFTAEQAVEAVKHVSFVEGVMEPKKGEFPITYLFKTARGEVGIMEVLGTVEIKHGDWSERGMKFRYKLVQGTGTTTIIPSKITLPKLNFGKESQGLQAALVVTPGEPFGLRIYLRNVSDKSIGLDGANYRQEDECLLTDVDGKPVPITRVTHDIKVGMGGGYHAPGQVAIFEDAGLSFQSLDKVPSSAGYVAQAKPGRYTLRLKLRLPGDDVPFAPNQGVWHGELETGPVTIEVKDPATQKIAPVADAIWSSHLGKPVEITVNDLQTTRENCALSLDTGKRQPVPASITLDALSQNKMTQEPAPSVAEASVRAQEVALTWARNNQVDAVAFVTTKGGKGVKCGLLCPELLVFHVENKGWTPDLADPRMLKEHFEKAMHEWNFIPRIAEITSDGDFPTTYLILDTRTHRRGVLQILGTSDQPRGVKISYRLIEGAAVKKITQATQPPVRKPSALANAIPTFESLTGASSGLIAKFFPDAVKETSADEFTAQHATQEFEIHTQFKTGEVAAKAQKQTGPSAEGFMLTVQRLKAPLVSAAADLPQSFDRPYWKSYVNSCFDPKTGQGVAVYFDFGARLDPDFKRGMLELLQLRDGPVRFTPVQAKALPNVAETWGEAVDGVQASLRADREEWWKGEMPALKLKVRNQGEHRPFVARQQEVADVEFDGQWFMYSGPVDVLSGPIQPGESFDNIAVVLDPKSWQSKATHEPLALKAGEHTVRVSMGLEVTPSVRVISNPIKIKLRETREPPLR